MPNATYTEDQHIALMTAAVQSETAALTERNTSLAAEIATLQGEKDVLEASVATLTTERDEARQELADYKAEVEEKAAVDGRKATRLEEAKAAADHLPDDYFTPERAERWAAQSDDDFAQTLADLGATKPAAGSGGRESAAFKGSVKPAGAGEKTTGNLGAFLGARGRKS